MSYDTYLQCHSLRILKTIWLEICDSRFGIQDSILKVWKYLSRIKLTDLTESKYLSTIVLLQSFYFKQKVALSYAGAFQENSLSVTCCTFGKLQIRTFTSNRFRFKNQFSDTLKLLDHNCNHQPGFLKL